MTYRWRVAPLQADLISRLTTNLRLSPLMAQCLVNRGLVESDSICRFLDPRLKHLSDPFLLPEMTLAVERLLRARESGERVVLLGDYDVDGVTSTALLADFLGRLGWAVECYLPERFGEGYGLSRPAAENCLSRYPAGLLVAVDCGSTAADTVNWLWGRGVEVVVVDHHQVAERPSKAVAVLNPRLAQGGEPKFEELCSVGLAFKLAHALLKTARARGIGGAEELDLKPYLDLVALGTIADLVPLTGENRILVNRGLEWLERSERPGIAALKEVAQVAGSVGSYEVGFQLAPRLNAAGRLETAQSALDLLRASDSSEARRIAMRLDEQNRERQQVERSIAEEAIRRIRAQFDPGRDYAIVEGGEAWHIGVVGIVASRVVQEFHRPAVILGGANGQWRGSGRSIHGLDLAAALRECDALLTTHGGHAMAAGVGLRTDDLDAFRAKLNEVVRARLDPADLTPELRVDAEARLADLTVDRMRELEGLKETGMGNPRVQLVCRGLTLGRPGQRMGREKQHAKLWVRDGAAMAEVVWWNAGDAVWPEGRFDLAFAPQLNEFNGRVSVQLRLLDWRGADL